MGITLSQNEMKIVTYVFNSKQKHSSSLNHKDKMIKDADQTRLDGFVAEFAFAKKFNYWPDMNPAMNPEGVDFTLRNGLTVDIKTTRRANGRLITYPDKKNKACDIYILTVLTSDDTVEFKGYATKEELFADSSIVDLGYGPTYAVDQNKLRPIEELLS